MQNPYQLIDHILGNADISIVPDSCHGNPSGSREGNVYVGALLRIKTAAHADVGYIRYLFQYLLPDSCSVAHQHRICVCDPVNNFPVVFRKVLIKDKFLRIFMKPASDSVCQVHRFNRYHFPEFFHKLFLLSKICSGVCLFSVTGSATLPAHPCLS